MSPRLEAPPALLWRCGEVSARLRPPLWFSNARGFANDWLSIYANNKRVQPWQLVRGKLLTFDSATHFLVWARDLDLIDWEAVGSSSQSLRSATAADIATRTAGGALLEAGAVGWRIRNYYGRFWHGVKETDFFPGDDIAIWDLAALQLYRPPSGRIARHMAIKHAFDQLAREVMADEGPAGLRKDTGYCADFANAIADRLPEYHLDIVSDDAYVRPGTVGAHTWVYDPITNTHFDMSTRMGVRDWRQLRGL